MTLDEIKAKCRMEGECWIWTGSKDRHGNPVFYSAAAQPPLGRSSSGCGRRVTLGRFELHT